MRRPSAQQPATAGRVRTRVGVAAAVVLAGAVLPSRVDATEVSNRSDVSLAGDENLSLDEALASAIDTRRRLGFRDEPTYVAQLVGSAADVGSRKVGLPLNADELVEVQRREAVVGLFHESLEAHVRTRPDFGGVYVDQLAGGIIVVLTTGDADLLGAELHEAEPKLSEDLVVRHVGATAAQLEEAAARLFQDRREWSNDIPVFEARVDHQHSQIALVVPPDQVDLAARAAELALAETLDAMNAQDTGIGIHVEGGEQHVGELCNSRTDCYNPLRPGIRITSLPQGAPDAASCTMGFHIVVNGARNVVTAGHCPSAAWYHYAYGLVGVQTGSLYCAGPRPYMDIKRISVSSSQQASGVYGSHANEVIHVTTSAYPTLNATIRGSLGRSNALRTGVITAAPIWYSISGSACDLVGARHNLATTGGDSGSPLWLPSPNRATGVHSSSLGAFAQLHLGLGAWNASVYS